MGGADVVVMLQLLVALPEAESVAPATKEFAPVPPGVPVIAPVEGVRLKPDGSAPVMENV
jgi:hypothetical protein